MSRFQRNDYLFAFFTKKIISSGASLNNPREDYATNLLYVMMPTE
ncbi:MAG: hypothetical protein RIC35_11945 [Marinoscillum sp.]